MKSTYIVSINVLVIVFTHVVAFNFLNEYAIEAGSCGMGMAIIAGSVPLIINFLWSCATIFLVSKIPIKQYFDDMLLYVTIAITGNSLIAYFAESYLWALLIIPYLLFIGQGFYLKFESK
jgi:hypothetical protein